MRPTELYLQAKAIRHHLSEAKNLMIELEGILQRMADAEEEVMERNMTPITVKL